MPCGKLPPITLSIRRNRSLPLTSSRNIFLPALRSDFINRSYGEPIYAATSRGGRSGGTGGAAALLSHTQGETYETIDQIRSHRVFVDGIGHPGRYRIGHRARDGRHREGHGHAHRERQGRSHQGVARRRRSAIASRLDGDQRPGEFSFTKVDTGITLLAATKEGYQNGTGFALVASDNGTYNVNITLRPPADTTPGMLQGTVRSGNAQGSPLAGATVVVSRTGGGTTLRDTVTTDAQGRYSIASLAPAIYSVRGSDTGYQAATVTATVRAHDTTVANIILLPNNASGSVSGKVVKASDGSAVSGTEIDPGDTRGGGGWNGPDRYPEIRNGRIL